MSGPIIEAAQMTGMEPFSSGFSFGVYQYLELYETDWYGRVN